MAKYLITTTQGEFVLPPPSFTRTGQQIHQNFQYSNFAIYLPSQPSLGHKLGFHIYFHHGILGLHPFLQFGYFELHITSFNICMLQAVHRPTLGLLFTYLFLFYRKENRDLDLNNIY